MSIQFVSTICLVRQRGLDLRKRGLDLRKSGLDLRKRSLDLRKRGLDYYLLPKLIWRTHDFVNTARQHNLLCPAEGPGHPE